MQYLRVLLVVGAAALVTRLVMGDQAQTVSEQIIWFPPLSGIFLQAPHGIPRYRKG